MNQAQVRTILWLSFLSGALMMLLLVLITPKGGSPNDPLSITLLTAGVGMALASAAAPKMFSGQSYVIGLALADAAAVVGVVIHFVTGWPHAWILPVIGMAAMGMQFPRSD